jgi:serine/threonine-protein kinase
MVCAVGLMVGEAAMTDVPSGEPAAPIIRGAELSAGSLVAGYLIEERLGTGGMAVVYLAVDQRLGRRVALKILSPGLAGDPEFRRRFIRESRTAAAVDDPHIIPVFEAGEADEVLFIAMRYVPGGDVHSLVRQTGPLAPARAALILSQAASALDAAHRLGLVHRDVKPANMLMDVSGSGDRPDHLYLSDFGISKDAMSASALTGKGMFVGTLDYVAPEQIDGRPVSGQTDQYALACSAFELLSGAPPFPRDPPTAVVWAHMSARPPLLAARRPDLPPRVDRVLSRALAKSPAERYATCREFTDALRSALGLVSYEAGGSTAPPAIRTPTEAAVLAPPALQPHPAAWARQAAMGPDTAARPPSVGHQAAQATGPGQAGHAVAGWATVPQQQRARHGWPLIFAAACVVVAAAVVAVIILGRPEARGRSGGAPPTPTPVPATATPSSNTFVPLRTLAPAGDARGVNAVAFSSLGRLATAGNSGIVYLWDPSTGARQATLTTASPVTATAFSPDGKTLAVGDRAGQIDLWDLTSQPPAALDDPQGAQVEAVAFSPAGKILATGDSAGITYLWDAATGKQLAALPDPGSKGVNTLAFSPDGSTLAAGDYNGTAYLWQVSTGARLHAFPMPSDVLAVAFSPDGSTLAAGDYNGTAYLWQVSTGRVVARLSAPGAIEALAFNPDGRTLATGDENGNTYLWQLSDDRQVQILPSTGVVWAVGFNPTGTQLAVGDRPINGHYGATYLWRAG